MKHYLLAGLFLPLLAWAQTPCEKNSAGSVPTRCEVVYLPDSVLSGLPSGTISLFGEPSVFPSAGAGELIFDNGYEYVYRLAMCISPEYVNGVFGGDKAKARAWMQEAGAYLNTVYPRDLGIRFEIVMDDRLILTEYPSHKFEDSYGTLIIDERIGSDKYDCGILICQTNEALAGRASLNAVYSSKHKGNAMANLTHSTIAHELGHLFGAKHTHQKNDALCVEPGDGQSIMSYGEPRTSFSLASVIAIRSRLKNQCYYLNANRNPLEIAGGTPGENANIPYVVPSASSKPRLNRSLLRKNYTVTEGTRFQFYIPVENAASSFTYGAQGYDASVYGYETNALQPIYSLTPYPCAMFQPYYNEGNNHEWKKDAVLVKHSDAFRQGRYRFLLAAADNSRYDLEPVNLHIVPGKAFQLKTELKMDQTQGKPLELEWESCAELYGEDSQVRILLSDDFGQTYKYVIDDNVPNTGKWKGYWPFVKIERTSYRNFSESIRGGVIKIEVKNEAAYAVSEELPAFTNPDIVYQGGFMLTDWSTYVRFKDAPEPYLFLDNADEIPSMGKLEAYHKNNVGKTVMADGKEERVGNVIRRRWKAEISGTSSTYTQLIVLKEDSVQAARRNIENRADELKLVAVDLHSHQGELGYPLKDLQAMRSFETAYAEVFDDEGSVQSEVTMEKIEVLRKAIQNLSAIHDNEIVKPSDRHYYTLRNFQDIYGRYAYYYVAQHESADVSDYFTADSTQATLWRCVEKDGRYSFTAADGRKMYLNPLIIPEYRETLELDRGYTWGAFTLVDENNACGQLMQGGQNFTKNEQYANDRPGYRINRNSTVSTDFQFLPIRFIDARTSAEAHPWNILVDTQELVLSDSYRDLYAADSVRVETLLYTRSFDNTDWQAFYLPFETKLSDWATHCEVAYVDEIKYLDTDGDGISDRIVAEWVMVDDGTLQANHPYLIRAKDAGTYTFTLTNVIVQPTAENHVNIATSAPIAMLVGNYGVVSAERLSLENGYILQGNALHKVMEQGEGLLSMRWYLAIDAADGNLLPESITLVRKGDTPVDIANPGAVSGCDTAFPKGVYTVTGIRLYPTSISDLAPGFYIIDGEKTVVK